MEGRGERIEEVMYLHAELPSKMINVKETACEAKGHVFQARVRKPCTIEGTVCS